MDMTEFQDKVKGGRIFGVTFTKRTTGETRKMQARLGVTKHLAGGELAYDPAKLKLLPVFDMVKEAYRQIPLDAISELALDGAKYRWDAELGAFILQG